MSLPQVLWQDRVKRINSQQAKSFPGQIVCKYGSCVFETIFLQISSKVGGPHGEPAQEDAGPVRHVG